MKRLLFFINLLMSQVAYTQNLHQTLRGKIIDIDGQFELVGATVTIRNNGFIKHTTAAADGSFRFDRVPLGRAEVKVSFIGYEDKHISNIELTAGKEVVLQIAMQEAVKNLNEIIIKAQKVKGEVENEMALISARQVTVDETQRYAGSFNDPARMVSGFAGVTGGLEGNNDIVVRGNSPKYIQWRLEGVEMPNPNHFGDVGGTGGPISALNSNILANSDFFTGAFAPEYGNVLSGAFDVKFRKGNDEKREYTFGLGALGIEATAEGPIKKMKGASYLFNYRYSSLALLDNLGVVDFGGVPKYQDAALKIVLPSQKLGAFTIFGMGGISAISETNIDSLDKNLAKNQLLKYQKYSDFKLKNNLYILGVNHLFSFSNNVFLQSGLSVSGSSINETEYHWLQGKVIQQGGEYLRDSLQAKYINYLGKYANTSTIAHLKLNYKISNKHKIEVGAKYTSFANNYLNLNFKESRQRTETDIDFDKSLAMVRNFASWKYRINENVTLVSGFHNVYLPFTDENSFEPRLSLRFQKADKPAYSIAYGRHSSMEQISNYFVGSNTANQVTAQPNKNLALLKADHLVVGYEKHLGENHLLKFETYYQRLFDLPVENDPSSYYATINEVSGFKNIDLLSSGSGKNYGIELSFERFFSHNFYYLATASLYQSKYTAADGKERNTTYNNNYAFNFLVGREFTQKGKKQNKTYGLNLKLFYVGPRKMIPLLRDAQGNLAVDTEKQNFFDYSKAYKYGLDPVFQSNISASLKINRAGLTHELAVDIINANNTQARISEYYDEREKSKINYVRPLALIPNLVYRVKF